VHYSLVTARWFVEALSRIFYSAERVSWQYSGNSVELSGQSPGWLRLSSGSADFQTGLRHITGAVTCVPRRLSRVAFNFPERSTNYRHNTAFNPHSFHCTYIQRPPLQKRSATYTHSRCRPDCLQPRIGRSFLDATITQPLHAEQLA
jgi:hypothetical protein